MNRKSLFFGALSCVGLGLAIGCGGTTTDSSGYTGGMTGMAANPRSGAQTPSAMGLLTLPANSIIFSKPGSTPDTLDLRSVAADGTDEQPLLTLPVGISGLAIDPTKPTQKYFGAQRASTGQYGIWKNSSIDPTSAVSVVTPAFDVIYTIAVTKDGKYVLFTAGKGSEAPKLYRAATSKVGGTATALDEAVDFSLSPDGEKVAYSKFSGSSFDLFTITVAPGKTAAAPVKLIATPGDEEMPQFSRDGKRIVFVGTRGGSQSDIFTVKADGTDELQVTTTTDDSERSPTYNGDGSAIAYVVPSGVAAGIYRSPSAGGSRTAVKLGDAMTDAFWTIASGKAKAIQSFSLSRRAKFTKPKEEKAVAPKAG